MSMPGAAIDLTSGSLLEAASLYVGANFANIVEKELPLLDMIINRKKNFNKGIRSGTALKHAIGTTNPGTIGSNATSANPWVARSAGWANQVDTTGKRYFMPESKFSTFLMTQIEAPVAYTKEMMQLYEQGGRAQRASILQNYGSELLEYCRQAISTGICGTGGATNAARNTWLSLNYMCAGNTTVGGINPATETLYAATNLSATLDLTRTLLDTKQRYMKQQQKAKSDLLLLSSNSSGADLYARAVSFVDANVQFQKVASQEGGDANYGYENYLYRGMLIASDSDLPANEGYMMDTSELFYDGDEKPDKTDKYIIPLTTVEAETWYLFGCLSVRDVSKQLRFAALTA